MFQNYLELYHGYVEFYMNIWSDDVAKGSHPSDQHNEKLPKSHVGSVATTTTAAQKYLFVSSSNSSGSSSTIKRTEVHLDELVRQNLSNANASVQGGQMLEASSSLGNLNSLNVTDLLYIVTIFLNLLFLRRCLSNWMKKSALIKSLGLRGKDQERLDESVWRLIYYTFSSSWLLYTCFFRHQAQKYLYKNTKVTEYLFGVDLDEYLICMLETGFYLHATYAIVFEDIWRRDSPMMLLHHIAAIFSVLGLYATRTHRIGLTAVVLRDTCDVLLEVTKIFLCLRLQRGKIIKSMNTSIKYMLVIFTGAFVINQLYYYPLFCLYHALNMVKVHKLRTPSMTGIMSCALIFLLLDLLWFGLILRLLYRMLFTDELPKDLREYDDDDDDDDEDESLISSSESEQMGTVAQSRSPTFESNRRAAKADHQD